MKVLVVGGGGREHALVWKIGQSEKVDKIYCAPGNAGIAGLATCVSIEPDRIETLVAFARKEGIDLTVVGPEAPLVAGIVDAFEAEGLKVFGPRRRAAEIEGSKAFAKGLMKKYGIPTARHRTFEDPDLAREYVRQVGAPVVLKADGLAAGKGVIVAQSEEEALVAVERIMEVRAFGAAGRRLVVEEYLEGEEVSVLALVDGEHFVPLASSQDHKRAYDGDEGPNTGGMGAYSPAPCYTPGLAREVEEKVLGPVVKAMVREGRPYRGILYAGLMLTQDGPRVLEFNCRFGDPETQVVLPRMKTDLVAAMEAVVEGRLEEIELDWYPEAAVGVVLASGGYPLEYEEGKVIRGLEEAAALQGVLLFHAGTDRKEAPEGGTGDGPRREEIVTAGGRVLGVVALGESIRQAVDLAYRAVGMIEFEGMHYRRDIAHRALSREGE